MSHNNSVSSSYYKCSKFVSSKRTPEILTRFASILPWLFSVYVSKMEKNSLTLVVTQHIKSNHFISKQKINNILKIRHHVTSPLQFIYSKRIGKEDNTQK